MQAAEMAKLLENVRRGTAKADTVVAIAALLVAGWAAGRERWVIAMIAMAVGLVFIVSSGSYCWRKGFVAGKRAGLDN